MGGNNKNQKGNVRTIGSKSRTETGKKKSMGMPSSTNSSSSTSGDKERTGSVCWYCKETHRGGWRQCFKRKKEAPDWKPSGEDDKLPDKKTAPNF